MNENRREFFRVGFNRSIDGTVVIAGREALPVDIYDVSVNGLRFFTSIDIPLLEKVECRFEILDSGFQLEGSIIRKSKTSDDMEYGVEFTVDQGTSSHLFKQLNYYQIRQRKGDSIEE
ncbi:PilZ domain-containing protein [Planococcus sp. YIM B11945]|uniref:PilZ domain-containing protein n=1 Tax=Planococcus sp. YIM B11945 TaxID=3435410 RepID=UPI003D7DBCB4